MKFMILDTWRPSIPSFSPRVDVSAPVTHLSPSCCWQRQHRELFIEFSPAHNEASCENIPSRTRAGRVPTARRRFSLPSSTLGLEALHAGATFAAATSAATSAGDDANIYAVKTTANASAVAAGRRRGDGSINASTRLLASRKRAQGEYKRTNNEGIHELKTRTETTAVAATPSKAHQVGAEEISVGEGDLVALLGVLGLSESDIVPELSKKSRAILGLAEDDLVEERCATEGDAAAAAAAAAAVGDDAGARGWEAGIHRDGDRGSTGRSAPWLMMEEVGMKPHEVAAVVTSYPILLTVAADHARVVIRWLRRRAGLSTKQVVKVLKSHPGILRYDVGERLEPHAAWLESEGLNKAGVNKVLSKLPQMLGLGIESNLRPKTGWLQTSLGLTPDGVASVLKSFPAVLALSVDNLEGKAAWLETRLGVERPVVAKLLKLNPSLFGSSIENSLEPKLTWLREGLGLEVGDVSAVVRSCPNVLSYSIEDNLEPTMAWLQKRMDLDQQGVAAMVRTFPSILGLNPEKNIETKLTWLKDNLDLDEELVLALVKTCPQLLGCSTKANLGPTLRFFREELGGSREEIRDLVLSNPTLLRYSLKKRMIPRAAAIENAGIGRPVFRDHVKPIAAYTDSAFGKWLDSLVLLRGIPHQNR